MGVNILVILPKDSKKEIYLDKLNFIKGFSKKLLDNYFNTFKREFEFEGYFEEKNKWYDDFLLSTREGIKFFNFKNHIEILYPIRINSLFESAICNLIEETSYILANFFEINTYYISFDSHPIITSNLNKKNDEDIVKSFKEIDYYHKTVRELVSKRSDGCLIAEGVNRRYLL